jgi:type IV secretion system protein VirD4
MPICAKKTATRKLRLPAGMQAYKHRPPGMKINRCMFLIDELPAFGRLAELPRDIATMAGYGVYFTLVIQGIDQLREVYGDAATTIINNCAFKWFCNINDLHTAKFLSDTLGRKTVQTITHGSSQGMRHGQGSSGQSSGALPTRAGVQGRPRRCGVRSGKRRQARVRRGRLGGRNLQPVETCHRHKRQRIQNLHGTH